ncbi:hypothetical protein KSP40_PGU007579 [Platanthera guangdongensis]|uniref:Uncharacterized protein n=1 Tax=Platanthera guangdongensis TaxID=2320717 RepID=A0ABR2LJN2_9ASPA
MGSFPFTYLGIPIFCGHGKPTYFEPLWLENTHLLQVGRLGFYIRGRLALIKPTLMS